VRGLRVAADELDWIEDRLGPYPFSSLGIVLVDSRSGMETQTMITLGTTDYTTSPEVIVHEMVHQWYGNEVTPVDWRDVWMNEGMAMYLQSVWQADDTGTSLETVLRRFAPAEPLLRREAGPPADYDPATFGRGNVYYSPALMWDELRERLGEEEFWSGVRAWPEAHRNGNAGYDEITTWWSERTGEDLSSFFHAWLLGETSPEWD
jgi:aminopeptidase N